ncbi:MAG: MarR family winged helix-turn-helix transcriptional regulator [Burkholderiales bacterium]|nr:MarR family winged helix-turn-helix transcriptional regulator [Burkholderiales bacterium]
MRGCTCFKLRRLTRRVTQHYDRELAPAGLRVTQFSLLSALAAREAVPMAELADMLDLDRTTLTRNVAPLEARGLVEIGPGSDARSRTARITPTGRAAREAALPHWRRAQSTVTGLVGSERLALLHDLLDEALGVVRSAADDVAGIEP